MDRGQLMLVGPSLRSECFDLPVGGIRQAREDVAQVSIRIDTATTAALHDGIEDGRAVSSLSLPNEQPIFLAERGRADGIFAKVIIDLDATIFEINAEQSPMG